MKERNNKKVNEAPNKASKLPVIRHDVKNSLSVIKVSVELLKMNEDLMKREPKLLKTIILINKEIGKIIEILG